MPTELVYIESDIPPGMTIAQYRALRLPPRHRRRLLRSVARFGGRMLDASGPRTPLR